MTEATMEPGGGSPEVDIQESKPTLGKSTLGDRGPMLSLGIPGTDGQLHRDIALRPWKGAVMRELGKLREETKQVTAAEHVALVLSHLCTRLGPHDFTKLQKKEKRLVVSQMYMGDVYHAYFWARLQSLGPQLFADITCPNCRQEMKGWETDLAGLDITIAESKEDTLWKYDLQVPVTIRGQEVRTLKMGPIQWYHVEQAHIEGELDLEGGKLAMVAGVICGYEGRDGELRLTEAEIDELDGRDIEGIVGALDHHYTGPDMRIEGKCTRPGCRAEFIEPINWRYQSFFGPSSRSRASSSSGTSTSPQPTSRAVG